MAFRRSVARLGQLVERADVSPSMKKWWKAYRQQDGLIEQSLSPYEQKIVSPLFENAPAKIMKYVKSWSIHVGPAFVTFLGLMKWADYEYEHSHREHWD